jgi:hypothetical protein
MEMCSIRSVYRVIFRDERKAIKEYSLLDFVRAGTLIECLRQHPLQRSLPGLPLRDHQAASPICVK